MYNWLPPVPSAHPRGGLHCISAPVRCRPAGGLQLVDFCTGECFDALGASPKLLLVYLTGHSAMLPYTVEPLRQRVCHGRRVVVAMHTPPVTQRPAASARYHKRTWHDRSIPLETLGWLERFCITRRLAWLDIDNVRHAHELVHYAAAVELNRLQKANSTLRTGAGNRHALVPVLAGERYISWAHQAHALYRLHRHVRQAWRGLPEDTPVLRWRPDLIESGLCLDHMLEELAQRSNTVHWKTLDRPCDIVVPAQERRDSPISFRPRRAGERSICRSLDAPSLRGESSAVKIEDYFFTCPWRALDAHVGRWTHWQARVWDQSGRPGAPYGYVGVPGRALCGYFASQGMTVRPGCMRDRWRCIDARVCIWKTPQIAPCIQGWHSRNATSFCKGT